MTHRTRGRARGVLIIAGTDGCRKKTACTNVVITVHTLPGIYCHPNYVFQINTEKA